MTNGFPLHGPADVVRFQAAPPRRPRSAVLSVPDVAYRR
jgi:hypothetical protein